MILKKSVVHLTLIAIVLLGTVNVNAEAPTNERVLWDKRPIPVALSIGKERLVHFPIEVRVWIPSSIENQLSVMAVNGVLYLTAHQGFSQTRIRVQSLETQKLYLLDLEASLQSETTDELIVMDSDYIESKSSAEDVPVVGDWYIRLTRFAALSLYAPERLMPSDRQIYTVQIDSVSPIALVRGGDIEAIPVKSWRGGGYYLTAIRLRNLSDNDVLITHSAPQVQRLIQRTVILSEDLRGDWLAATPQHTTLESAGNNDVTTLYLLSDGNFMESF